MPQPSYSPALAATDFFLFPKLKTPMKGNRDNRKIKTAAVGDTKKLVAKVFRELEKVLPQVWYIRGGFFEGDKIVIDK